MFGMLVGHRPSWKQRFHRCLPVSTMQQGRCVSDT